MLGYHQTEEKGGRYNFFDSTGRCCADECAQLGRIGKKLKMKRFKQALRDIARNKAVTRLFDQIERTDDSPKRNSESDFAFYNRSSIVAVAQVRALMEDCVSRYPEKEVYELTKRLRSDNDQSFQSAIFELILHDMLFRQGFTLIPHPKLPNGSSKRPDFLVTDSDGNTFYLEAVLATESNEQDAGGEARKGVVFDALNDSPHQNFMVDVDDEGYPKSQSSGKKLVKAVHQWMDSLDPDEVQAKLESEGDLYGIEPLEWCREDWVVRLRPIPIKPERRGKTKTLIGIGSSGGGIVDSWSPICDAIRSKGNRYGELDKPLLIAVNLNTFHLELIDEMQALYGQEQIVFEIGSEDKEHRMERAPSGAWFGKGGPQYTRVSGAWLFDGLRPSSIAKKNQTIYHNPWAAKALPESLNCFPHAVLLENKIQWKNGLSLAEVFSLSEQWPE